jgi:hypothetical protein
MLNEFPRVNEKDLTKQMIQYALFKSAASRGAKIDPMVKMGRVHPDQLTSVNMMDVLTNQFKEYWLSIYKVEDISWIICQFQDLGSRSRD